MSGTAGREKAAFRRMNCRLCLHDLPLRGMNCAAAHKQNGA